MQVPQYDETRSSLFNDILAAGKARYPNEHPWQQLFLEGKLSQDQLKVWAQNRYYFHAGIPAKDANVFCKLPDDKDAKGMWLEKLQEEMGNCSLIAQNYQLGSENVGTLAVFGSKRMDYKRIISIVNHTAKIVSKLISENQGV